MAPNEQILEIRNYLINELNRFGFTDIVREVSIRFEEETEDLIPNFINNQQLLKYFDLTITLLEDFSNDHFEDIIGRLKQYTNDAEALKTIYVEVGNIENDN